MDGEKDSKESVLLACLDDDVLKDKLIFFYCNAWTAESGLAFGLNKGFRCKYPEDY